MARRSTLTRTTSTLLGAVALLVSVIPARAQDSSARVMEMTGQVSVMNGGYRTALNPGDPIKPQQLIITGPDGYAKFRVESDGSTFEVFPNSRVEFRRTLGNWKDLLNVYLGRIKVFIEHLPGGAPNHNEVSSPTAVISVRGTVFDVVVEDGDTTIVSVDEGTVWVRNLTAPGNAAVLQAGDSIRVIRNQPLAAAKVDRSGVVRVLLRAARDMMMQMPRTGQGPVGGVGSAPGAQGDKGKGGGTTTTTTGSPPGGTTTGTPPGGASTGTPPGGPPGG